MHTILIVDDDHEIRSLYSAVLEDEGFLTFVAENSAEALSILGEKKIDLVTLDIKIGKENGLDLLQYIVKESPELPVLICSGYMYYKNDYSSWQANEYIGKSSDLGQLKTAVKRLIACS